MALKIGDRLYNYKNFPSLFVISLLFFLSFSACNSPTNQTAPIPSNKDTVKLLYWQAPTILNPHLSTGFKDAEASRITLEPLASFNDKGELIPFLASEIPSRENGGIAPDGKSIIWKLKKGIKWSDGSPFTADDVVFTYQFITNPKVGATTAGNYGTIESVKALDDYTVKVSFKDVNPSYFLGFVGSEGMIIPRHLFEKFNGENARQAPNNLLAVGTGPYQVVQFKPGDTVIYEPNLHFREPEKIVFKKVEIKGGGDAISAARAVLQTGEADYAYNLQIEANIMAELEQSSRGKLLYNYGSLMERILINQTDPNKLTPDGERSNIKNLHPFFGEPKVREALSLAIDRDTIAQKLYGNTGKVAANFLLAPAEYNSPNTSYEFNLKKAVQLLDETGWEDSNGNGIRDKNGVEMQIVFQTSVNPLRQKTQEVIKQALQSIGIGVELKSVDPSIFFSSDPANNDTVEHFYADLQMFTTGNTSPDPGAYMKTYTCSEIPQKANNWSGDNYSRYCNLEYDRLWQESNKELDQEKRTNLFIKMNDILVKDWVVIPLVHRADVVAVGSELEGLDLTPWDSNTWNIINWKKK